MVGGNIRDFASGNPHLNRFELVGSLYLLPGPRLILLSWWMYVGGFNTYTTRTSSMAISKGWVFSISSRRRIRVQSICFRTMSSLMTNTRSAFRISVWRILTALVGLVSHPTRVTQVGPPLTWLRNSFSGNTRRVNRRPP